MPSPERRWWARFDNEATACPACRSSRIRVLDVFAIPRTPQRRRLAFISGCKACGVLFVNPLPTARELKKYYSEQGTWAERQSERVKETKSRAPRSTAAGSADVGARTACTAPGLGPGKVLDFGCGDGKFLNRMKARGWETYGIEPSSDAAFRKHRRLLEVPQDGAFDFVVLNHVLEHLLDPLDTLQQLAGSLRDGGILFVSTPRLDTLPLAPRSQVLPERASPRGEFLGDMSARAARASRVRDDCADRCSGARRRVYSGAAAAPASHRRAQRTPVALPARPLAAARRALAGYAAAEHGIAGRLQRWVARKGPSGADRSENERANRNRKRQAGESVTRRVGG